MEIYFGEKNELAEFEAINRGYRSDIFALVNEEIYRLHVYDIIRLKQDFESEVEDYGFFSVEPNLIIVKEVSLENIRQTIERLFYQKFFEKLKPENKNEVDLNKMHKVNG